MSINLSMLLIWELEYERTLPLATTNTDIKKGGQGLLTVKGSSNRMLPRFKEPILGYVTLRFLESRKHLIRGTFYCQFPLIQKKFLR